MVAENQKSSNKHETNGKAQTEILGFHLRTRPVFSGAYQSRTDDLYGASGAL